MPENRHSTGTYSGIPVQFEVHETLGDLLHHLEPGMILPGRIVRRISATRYILRLRGYNMVAFAPLDLQERDDVTVKVKRLTPYPVFKILYKGSI